MDSQFIKYNESLSSIKRLIDKLKKNRNSLSEDQSLDTVCFSLFFSLNFYFLYESQISKLNFLSPERPNNTFERIFILYFVSRHDALQNAVIFDHNLNH